MNRPRAGGWFASMAARLSLILVGGLLAAYALSASLLFYERYESATSMLMSNVEQDVLVAVKLLDRLPPDERERWLPLLERRTFRYALGHGADGPPATGDFATRLGARLRAGLGAGTSLRLVERSRDPERFEVQLALADGTPVRVDVRPSVMPIARWLPVVLAAQVALILLCTWLAVRIATRPLRRLADAAEASRPDGEGPLLSETGPREVVQAAAAFNAMRARIARHADERVRLLAAISHDLQTPITRMTLRVEAMPPSPERERLADDLDGMQRLVREGIAYARSAHGGAEPTVRVDVAALLEALVCDYADAGRPVTLATSVAATRSTRPQALKRVLQNLVDNALRHAGAAEVAAERADDGGLVLAVRDRGPGIPEDELPRVLEPFYRLEPSRNRDTGGTGLGLSIAHQLATAIGARLVLRNRDGGGLEAAVVLPPA